MFSNYQAYLLQKTSLFDHVAMAVTIKGVFIYMLLNMSHVRFLAWLLISVW